MPKRTYRMCTDCSATEPITAEDEVDLINNTS